VISHSLEVEHWLAERFWRRRIGACIYIALTCVLLVWRLTILNFEAPVISILFYVAAVLDAALGLSLIYRTWYHKRRTIQPIKHPFTVDVFVPVYTEPARMIEMTIRAAKEIDYPHETYLLDDGRRDELRELAERVGVHYVRRDSNRGAKAGNLNHALTLSSGELIAVFDADHIATRESLHKLIGFFEDEAIGMAQAPQMFYNEDAFIFLENHVGSGRWQEQSFFYDVSQPSREMHNALSGVGTGFVIRRTALTDIEGFPEATLTEDFHTTILLQKRQWIVAGLAEPVAWGVAVADVPEFAKTRHRWLHGNLHAMSHENLLFCRGLTLHQRLSYITHLSPFLESWQQVIYLAVPIYSMITLIAPFAFSPEVTFILFASLALQIVCLIAVGCGYFRFFTGQIFAMGCLFIYLQSTLGLFRQKMAWRISLKNVLGHVSAYTLLPQIFVMFFTALALSFAAKRTYYNLPAEKPPHYEVLLLFSCLLIGFGFWRAFAWVVRTIALARRTSEEYRFEAPVPILDAHHNTIGACARLSTCQARVTWLKGQVPSVGDTVSLLVPGFTIPVRVVEVGPTDRFRFECTTPEGHNRLWRTLYSVDWHRLIRIAPLCWQSRLLGLNGTWLPAVAEIDGQARWAVFQPENAKKSLRPHLIAAEGPAPQTTVSLRIIQTDQLVHQVFKAGPASSLDTPFPKDLNDQRCQVFPLTNSSLIP
jgi:cellulose synthase (UDP-forming)